MQGTLPTLGRHCRRSAAHAAQRLARAGPWWGCGEGLRSALVRALVQWSCCVLSEREKKGAVAGRWGGHNTDLRQITFAWPLRTGGPQASQALRPVASCGGCRCRCRCCCCAAHTLAPSRRRQRRLPCAHVFAPSAGSTHVSEETETHPRNLCRKGQPARLLDPFFLHGAHGHTEPSQLAELAQPN